MRQILVISATSGVPPDLFSGVSTGEWKYLSWEALTTEKLRSTAIELLLLVGLPDPSAALELLRRLKDRSIPSGIVAVLPKDLEPSDLALASTVADDFILWPERPE